MTLVTRLDLEKAPAAELRGLLEFETLLAELSSRFINLPPGEVDREIEGALRAVCELLGFDLAVLWQSTAPAPTDFKPTHFYSAEKGLEPPEPLRKDQFPWYAEQMMAGRKVAISSLGDFPAEAAVDRESCRLLGVKSNLCLPLLVGGERPVGILGLNTLRAERDWPEALVKRLQLVAQVFANALARKHHELKLLEGEERLALAADSAEAGLWTLEFATGTFWATERARALFGLGPDETLDLERILAVVHPDDRDLVRGTLEQSARGTGPLEVECRIVLPGDRGVRWISSRGRTHFRPTGEPERLMGVSFDVIRPKRDEDEHRMNEARLAAATDLAGLAFYEVDYEARSVFADDRFRDVCGISPGRERDLQVLEFWLEHLHPEDRPRVLALRQDLHEGRQERLSVEYRFLHPERGERWLHHLAGVARRSAPGRALKMYGVLRDITEARQAEEELRRSFAEIKQLKDRLQAESDYLKAEIGAIQEQSDVTGQSAAIQDVLRQVEQVAPTGSSVLVLGETGTGKERIAQLIHRRSPRHRQVMVRINCAALPSGLVESELFGREKGAYTGALTRQIGRFEVAHGSTLFLDEIGELSLELQAKLLRVLEAGEFERLGSSRTLKVDVRVIAATNTDLAEAIRRGRFREDLYYRLNVFPIRVPPLRERTEDIPALVWTFLGEFNTRMGKRISQVPRRTMEALQRYSWPGNVRELRNVIERGAIVSSGDTLRVPMLEAATPIAALPQTLAEAERELILRALDRAGWRIRGPQGAAETLGLNPSTLRSRMKKLNVPTRRPADADPS